MLSFFFKKKEPLPTMPTIAKSAENCEMAQALWAAEKLKSGCFGGEIMKKNNRFQKEQEK